MAELLIWLVAALGAVGGVILGHLLGRAEGKRTGREEAHQDARSDQIDRMDAGRKAVRDGRDAGAPADRLHDNDNAW